MRPPKGARYRTADGVTWSWRAFKADQGGRVVQEDQRGRVFNSIEQLLAVRVDSEADQWPPRTD